MAIIAGLIVSVPAACVCAPDDHFGLLLHPLFPHSHARPHGAPTRDDDAQVARVARADRAPGLSAATADADARAATAGLLLPGLLAALVFVLSRHRPPPLLVPIRLGTGPPTPPPR